MGTNCAPGVTRRAYLAVPLRAINRNDMKGTAQRPPPSNMPIYNSWCVTKCLVLILDVYRKYQYNCFRCKQNLGGMTFIFINTYTYIFNILYISTISVFYLFDSWYNCISKFASVWWTAAAYGMDQINTNWPLWRILKVVPRSLAMTRN